MPSSDNQLFIPDSFIALFVPPGRIKPIETRAFIAERYELCEDMAQLLTDHAKAHLFDLGIAEQDVLGRIQTGLLSSDAVVTAAEAGWVVRRLAELLDWPALA